MADRLTALDAAFLYIESERTPMHVGSVSIFDGVALRDGDGRVRIDDIRALLARRLVEVPRFRKRVVAPPLRTGLPAWVDDDGFDIAHHVHLTSLPAPGTRGQLMELACTLHMELLDRSRPLWEVWVVDGMADGTVALVQKTHHALVDGVSGVDVAVAMLDLSPEVREVADDGWVAEVAPRTVRSLVEGLFRTTFEPPTTIAKWAAGMAAHPRDGVERIRKQWDSLTAAGLAGLKAPQTTINQAIGTHRRLESVTLSLDALKVIGHGAGTKANDVVLAVVAGGFRRLFEDRGVPTDVHLNVMVPVSVRTDDERLGLGNRVSSLTVALPIGVADPAERLRTIAATTRSLREHDQPLFTSTLLTGADHFGTLVPTLASAIIHHQPLANVVVTNVPGSPVPLYLLGAPLLECVPVVPLAGNLDVSVGVLSYQHDIVIGLYADAATCPDVHLIAEGIEKSYAELVHAQEESA